MKYFLNQKQFSTKLRFISIASSEIYSTSKNEEYDNGSAIVVIVVVKRWVYFKRNYDRASLT